jgi:hypothetical protein
MLSLVNREHDEVGHEQQFSGSCTAIDKTGILVNANPGTVRLDKLFLGSWPDRNSLSVKKIGRDMHRRELMAEGRDIEGCA